MRITKMRWMQCLLALLLVISILTQLIPSMPVVEADAAANQSEEWLWPLKNVWGVGSNFGLRNYYDSNAGKWVWDEHKGIDIGAYRNESGLNIKRMPVRSTKSGYVVERCNKYGDEEYGDGGWGNYVLIKHNDGTYARYAHLCRDGIADYGPEILQGSTIGYVGDSGNSTGYHLHFEIYDSSKKRTSLNPMPSDRSKFSIKNTEYDLPSGWPKQQTNYIMDTHRHSYGGNQAGKCDICGYQYPFDSGVNWTDAGLYSEFYEMSFYTAPYMAPQFETSKYSSGEYIVACSVINAYDEKWLKTLDNLYIPEGSRLIHDFSPHFDFDNMSSGKDAYNSNRIFGVVTSNAPIKYAIGAIENAVTGEKIFETQPFDPTCDSDKSVFNYVIQGSNLDKAMKFDKLPNGTYRYSIRAIDIYDHSTTWRSNTFTVAPAKVCAQPVFNVSSVAGGKSVTISCATSGATLYFTDDGSTPTRNSKRYADYVPLFYNDYCHVRVIAIKDGYVSSSNEQKIYVDAVSISSSLEPTANGSWFSISCEPSTAQIYYSIGGGDYEKYTGTRMITKNTTISAYAEHDGYSRSRTITENVILSPPSTPRVSLNGTEADIPQGKTAAVKWTTDALCGAYSVKLYKDGVLAEEKNEFGNISSFVLPDAAVYSITVTALNRTLGNSEESEPVIVTAHAPLTVRFVDHDGAPCSVQTVEYGRDASLPVAPVRRGYSFNGWDGSYHNIKSDKTIRATYIIDSYMVRLYDIDGVRLLDTQEIQFGNPVSLDSATAKVTVPTGHIIAGWRIEDAASDSEMDINAVDLSMKLVAVTRWGNQNLPVVAVIDAAEGNADGTGYDVDVTLTCANYSVTNAYTKKVKVVASAKSSEDKLLACSIITLNLSEAISSAHSIFISYDGQVDHIEVSVLGVTDNDRTGTVLAQTVSATPVISYEYGGWSETRPDGESVQEKVQYRYRDNIRETTTSSTSRTLPGWIFINRTSKQWDWAESSTPIEPVDDDTLYREVQIVNSPSVNKTQYRYVAWTNGNKRHFCRELGNHYHGGSWYLTYSRWLDSASDPIDFNYFCPQTWHEHYGYHTSNYGPTWNKYSVDGSNYFWPETRVVQASQEVTTYRYRDTTYTYFFYRWVKGEWMEWGDEEVLPVSDSRDVETRTVYRCLGDSIEDTSGQTYPISSDEYPLGTTEDLHGKQAIIMVYKEINTDPTEAQLEYIGQVTLGEGNTYATTIKTKDEPSALTGDFIVTVALEGTTNLIDIGRIDAPVPEYTITYVVDGVALSSVKVNRGADAPLPEAPARTGHTFVKWDGRVSGIQRDGTLTAVYQPEQYAIAFMDGLNGTIDLSVKSYGETLTALASPTHDGYTFDGWEGIEGSTTVTGSAVYTARWTAETCTVTFRDAAGEVIDTQEVSYGQAATLPSAVTPAEGQVFLGWSNDSNWWNVTADIDVYPVIGYEETACAPVSSIGDSYFGEDATLELTAPDGATIFYTLDGSIPDPADMGATMEYTEPLFLTDTTYVSAISVEACKNNSEVISVYFELFDETVFDGQTDERIEIGVYNANVQPGDVTLDVQLAENPGLIGYQFFIECDRSVFYVDYDTETGVYQC